MYNDPLNRTDPKGDCPICGALIGAAIGFVGDLGAQLIANRGDIHNVNWGEVGRTTAAGAIGGLTGVGIARTAASVGAKIVAAIAVSGEIGAINKAVDNVAKGMPVDQGVGKAALVSMAVSAAGQAAGPIVRALGTPLPSVNNAFPTAGPVVSAVAATSGPVTQAVGRALTGAELKLEEKNANRCSGTKSECGR